MFSKEESKKLRQEFWISFGKSFPRKWILYDTKIKGLSLKFHFDLKKAMVSLDIETPDLERRMQLCGTIMSLKTILHEDYLPKAQFEDSLVLENRKEISRIFVHRKGLSIHNKNTWQEAMSFLNENMTNLERFFVDFRDVLDV